MERRKAYTKPLSPNLKRGCYFNFDVNEGIKLYQDLVLCPSCVLEKSECKSKRCTSKFIFP